MLVRRLQAVGRAWMMAWCLAAPLVGLPDLPFAELAKLYVYDGKADLKIQVDGEETADGVRVITLSYAGARGPVSATLVAPLRAGRHPAIVFQHQTGSKRDEFLAEAILLARGRLGAVCLLPDAPPARPSGWRRSFNPAIENNDREVQIQAVIDIRRGIDLLVQRPDVDATRIAYVGHSHGANWGVILMAVEPRLRAFALVAGFISVTDVMRGDDPDWADMRFAMGKENFERYVASLTVMDPVRYADYSLGRPALLQFGRFDPFISKEMAERFGKAMKGPARVAYYNAGHAVNDPMAMGERGEFLTKEIGMERRGGK